MKPYKDKVEGMNKVDEVVIEPFVASVHDIMYWNVIVFQYNPDIPEKSMFLIFPNKRKILFFWIKKSYETIRTLN